MVNATVIYSLLLISLVFIIVRLTYIDPQTYRQKDINRPLAFLL